MRNLTAAFLTFITTVGALYVFEATFGGVMDGLYYTFTNVTPTLTLPTAWNDIAVQTLTYWGLLWKSVIGIVLAMGVWVLRITFVDLDYQRPM